MFGFIVSWFFWIFSMVCLCILLLFVVPFFFLFNPMFALAFALFIIWLIYCLLLSVVSPERLPGNSANIMADNSLENVSQTPSHPLYDQITGHGQNHH